MFDSGWELFISLFACDLMAWVLLCMIAGIVLSPFMPQVFAAMIAVEVA